ncbi:MAG: hypothetical protein RSB98_04765 [Raoultibacter sp.]
MTHRIDVGSNVYIIDGKEAFADFLKDRLGFQTRDCFLNLFDKTAVPIDCPYEGECDLGGRVREEYQAIVQKAVEELRNIKVFKSDVERFNRIVDDLRNEAI